MGFKTTTQPAIEPITLQEAKDHLRVDDDFEDALISELIKTARDYVEELTRRPLITQSKTLFTDCFDTVIRLTANLQSVTSVKYIDTDGIQQALDPSEYATNAFDVIGTVFEGFGKSWPSQRHVTNAIEIEFVCGYGFAADVPASIRSSILLLVGHWFVNREAVTVGVSVNNTPMAVDMLLNPYRVISF